MRVVEARGTAREEEGGQGQSLEEGLRDTVLEGGGGMRHNLEGSRRNMIREGSRAERLTDSETLASSHPESVLLDCCVGDACIKLCVAVCVCVCVGTACSRCV